jgi:hypothetical protein
MFVIVEDRDEYEDIIRMTKQNDTVTIAFVGLIENEFYLAGERSIRPPRDMAHVMEYMADLDNLQEQFKNKITGTSKPERVTIHINQLQMIL